jgi:hypothetical protein
MNRIGKRSIGKGLRAFLFCLFHSGAVETKILSPELVLKLGTILAFLLPLFENVYVTFGRHKNTLLHLSFLYATLHISDKMNAGLVMPFPLGQMMMFAW